MDGPLPGLLYLSKTLLNSIVVICFETESTSHMQDENRQSLFGNRQWTDTIKSVSMPRKN
jgi:hypothetical protein